MSGHSTNWNGLSAGHSWCLFQVWSRRLIRSFIVTVCFTRFTFLWFWCFWCRNIFNNYEQKIHNLQSGTAIQEEGVEGHSTHRSVSEQNHDLPPPRVHIPPFWMTNFLIVFDAIGLHSHPILKQNKGDTKKLNWKFCWTRSLDNFRRRGTSEAIATPKSRFVPETLWVIYF